MRLADLRMIPVILRDQNIEEETMSQQQVETLGRFFDAARSGDYQALRGVLAGTMRGELDAHVTNDKEREGFLAMQREHAPDRFEIVEEVETGAEGVAGLRVRATRATDGGQVTEWLIAEFAEEDGECRLHGLFPGSAPDADPMPVTKRAADDDRGSTDDYRTESHTNLGGPIVSFSPGDEYSVLVLRVVDSEQTVFLPPLESIAAAGIDPALLVPDEIVEVEGHPHATDECKVLGTRLTIRDD